jgi:hypothetical protein
MQVQMLGRMDVRCEQGCLLKACCVVVDDMCAGMGPALIDLQGRPVFACMSQHGSQSGCRTLLCLMLTVHCWPVESPPWLSFADTVIVLLCCFLPLTAP